MDAEKKEDLSFFKRKGKFIILEGIYLAPMMVLHDMYYIDNKMSKHVFPENSYDIETSS